MLFWLCQFFASRTVAFLTGIRVQTVEKIHDPLLTYILVPNAVYFTNHFHKTNESVKKIVVQLKMVFINCSHISATGNE